MSKKESLKNFVKQEYQDISIKKNIDFPVDNIIVGLLKNMLRKNVGYGREGFMVYDNYFFIVELDSSGFEEELILSALEELTLKSQKSNLQLISAYLMGDNLPKAS